MTSRITQDSEKGELGFPKLMKYADTDSFVFFVVGIDDNDAMIGFCVDSDHLGEEAKTYTLEGLIDFHGTVELRNE